VRTNEEVKGALDEIAGERPDALIVLPSLDPTPNTLVPDFGASHGLPVVYSDRTGADTGGLMSLGPNYIQLHRRAAWFVDRIIKGAQPADLPVEQPTQFDFVLNFKAAEAMGLSTPQSVVLQATDVLR
jgi:putative tryptophan/tyrosine transport system substrate-binding protein